MGFKYCQRELDFDIANENCVLMLPIRIGLWYYQCELGFDVANENSALNIVNVNWVLDK